MGKGEIIKGAVKAGGELASELMRMLEGGADAASAVSKYDLPPGTRPEYLGAAPDRSGMTFLRYPGKPSPRVQQSIGLLSDPENPARKQMEADINAGMQLGGSDWYNTEELRNWFVDAHGPEKGDQEWRQFMQLMGATSPGSNVSANIGNAAMVRNRLATDPAYAAAIPEATSLEAAGPLAASRPKGYGHKAAKTQEMAVGRLQAGGWEGAPEPGVPAAQGSWTDNPKPKGFANSLMGNGRNIAADLHFTRYMGMASNSPDLLNSTSDVSTEFANRIMAQYPDAAKYFMPSNGKTDVIRFNPKNAVKDGAVPMDAIADYPSVWAQKPNDNEYKAFEDFMAQVAKARGMTPAQVQANLWMGAAKRTGVDDASQGTFMELFRDRADKYAKKTGKTRAEVIDDFIRNKGLLTIPGGAIGYGLMTQPNQTEDQRTQGILNYMGGL